MNNITLKNQIDLLEYFDTYRLLTYIKLKDKKKVKLSYLTAMIGLLFKNSCSLNESEFKLFKKILHKRFYFFLSYWRECSFRDLIKTVLFFLVKYQCFYRMVYFKKS